MKQNNDAEYLWFLFAVFMHVLFDLIFTVA